MDQTNTNFEVNLQVLSQLVEEMEKGNLSLEESLKYFENGIQHIRQCQALLQKAEQRIQVYHKIDDSLQSVQSIDEE